MALRVLTYSMESPWIFLWRKMVEVFLKVINSINNLHFHLPLHFVYLKTKQCFMTSFVLSFIHSFIYLLHYFYTPQQSNVNIRFSSSLDYHIFFNYLYSFTISDEPHTRLPQSLLMWWMWHGRIKKGIFGNGWKGLSGILEQDINITEHPYIDLSRFKTLRILSECEYYKHFLCCSTHCSLLFLIAFIIFIIRVVLIRNTTQLCATTLWLVFTQCWKDYYNHTATI